MLKYNITVYRMISDQSEIEKLINNKFMKKIQSATTIYEINKPDNIIIKESDKVSKKNENQEKYENQEKNENQEKKYNYLDDEPLHKIMESTVDTECHYVLYNIINETTNPFIKYLMYNDENLIKFPNHKISVENIEKEVDESSDSENENEKIIPYIDNESDTDNIFSEESVENGDEIYILDQCSQYLEKNFNIEYESLKKNYKGYVKVEDRLYIFINVSIIDIKLPENYVFSWVITDEIINKHVSNNIPICNIIVEMFSKNDEIKYIYDENNVPIEIPILVYICEKGENEYVNITSQSNTNISIITNKLQHSIFGNIAMFSTNRFQNDEKIYERYCLFTKNSIYILHNDFTKSDISMIDDRSCIRFLYNKQECWAVKNIILYSRI